MKLSVLISYNFIVYVAMAILLSSNTFVHTDFCIKEVKTTVVKQNAVAFENTKEVLHSELLYSF